MARRTFGYHGPRIVATAAADIDDDDYSPDTVMAWVKANVAPSMSEMLAAVWLREQLLDRQREIVHRIEMEAVNERIAQQEAEWEAGAPERERRAEEIREASAKREAEISAAMHRKINEAMEEYKRHVIMEWTEELLGQAISLPDGSRTTWGEASAAQHKERRDMFRKNAVANAEGAARHEQALEALASSGASCLNELVKQRV